MPFIRREVLLVPYAVLFFILSAFYFREYPIPLFGLRLCQLALSLGLALLWAGFGRRLLRGLWRGRESPGQALTFESFLYSLGLGALPFVALLFVLGLTGGFRPWAMGLLGLALFVVGARDGLAWAVWGIYSLNRAPLRASTRVLAVVILSGAFLCALAPPTYYDSLVYHLALPAKYLQEGRMGFVPYNQYAHFPQNMELLFGWFMGLGSDVSAQIFNVLLAALLGVVVLWLGTWRKGHPQSPWPILLYLTAPCVILLSSETYVEVPTAFWTTLSVLAAARGLETNQRPWFVLAGAMGGFAAGIKYTGVMTPVILTGLVILWPRRQPWRARFLDGAAIAGVSFALFVPWMVKNYFFTGGNPVFPFLPGLFPAHRVYMYKEAAAAYFEVLSEYKGSSALLQIFQLPFRLAGDVTKLGGGFDVTGDLGWMLPLTLLPLALLSRKADRTYSFLTAYVILHTLLWGAMRPVLRFLFPIFPLVCWVAGEGLSSVLAGFGRWARAAAAAAVILFGLSGGVLLYIVESPRGPMPAALGDQSREKYLARKLDYYPAMQRMALLPQNSRILFFGDQRGYYCPRPYVAPMVLLPQPLHAWADGSATSAELRRRISAEGFTHLFFNRREAERLRSYRIFDFTPRGHETFVALLRDLPVEEDTGAWVIYRVAP